MVASLRPIAAAPARSTITPRRGQRPRKADTARAGKVSGFSAIVGDARSDADDAPTSRLFATPRVESPRGRDTPSGTAPHPRGAGTKEDVG